MIFSLERNEWMESICNRGTVVTLLAVLHHRRGYCSASVIEFMNCEDLNRIRTLQTARFLIMIACRNPAKSNVFLTHLNHISTFQATVRSSI